MMTDTELLRKLEVMQRDGSSVFVAGTPDQNEAKRVLRQVFLRFKELANEQK